MKIGDKVIWRNGKSRSKRVLPLGIANCEIVDLGQTINGGQEVASIKLPEGWPPIEGFNPKEPFWVLIADLEA